jgi:polyhydroxybutyrate depolymerase
MQFCPTRAWLIVAVTCLQLGCSEDGASSGDADANGNAGANAQGDAGANGNAGANAQGDAGANGSGNAGGSPNAADDFPLLTATPGRAEYTFSYGGLDRLFLVYVPQGYTSGLPLVMVLHGGGGRAKQMFDQHPLEAFADELGYVMVAPQGTPKEGEQNSFDWNAQAILETLDSGVDDVGYLEEVLLGVSRALDIDAGRRYVAGFSGGASMSVRFAADKSELVAAIATFAGKVGLSEAGAPFVFSAAPSTPVSVQMAYGTLDPNYEGELKGDVLATSAHAGIDWWTEANGCDPTPLTQVQGVLTSDTYAGCDAGTVVRLVSVDGMDHLWPEKGSPFDLNGTKLLLDFFTDKVKP